MMRSHRVKRLAVGSAVFALGLLMVGSVAASATANDQSGAGASAESGNASARRAEPAHDQEAGQGHAAPDNSNGQTPQSGGGASLNQPQPASNADFSGKGANHTGAYDSTRDGSPSGNGNGGGAAVGEPCAGCVGKADNKNPSGQFPDGTDANQGYECDGNSGIGQTNPAHTGCVAETAVPSPSVLPEGILPVSVLGLSLSRTAPAPVVSAAVGNAPAGSLPMTGSGSGLTSLALAGLAMIFVGALLLGRRRSHAGTRTAAG
jgi:LPXTG-motif cell wall-anchored protein